MDDILKDMLMSPGFYSFCNPFAILSVQQVEKSGGEASLSSISDGDIPDVSPPRQSPRSLSSSKDEDATPRMQVQDPGDDSQLKSGASDISELPSVVSDRPDSAANADRATRKESGEAVSAIEFSIDLIDEQLFVSCSSMEDLDAVNKVDEHVNFSRKATEDVKSSVIPPTCAMELRALQGNRHVVAVRVDDALRVIADDHGVQRSELLHLGEDHSSRLNQNDRRGMDEAQGLLAASSGAGDDEGHGRAMPDVAEGASPAAKEDGCGVAATSRGLMKRRESWVVKTSEEQVRHVYAKRRDVCSVDIIVNNLKDMLALSTSILRSEAAKHRVVNSSRKRNFQVVEELWDHYLQFHIQQIEASAVQMAAPAPFNDAEALDGKLTSDEKVEVEEFNDEEAVKEKCDKDSDKEVKIEKDVDKEKGKDVINELKVVVAPEEDWMPGAAPAWMSGAASAAAAPPPKKVDGGVGRGGSAAIEAKNKKSWGNPIQKGTFPPYVKCAAEIRRDKNIAERDAQLAAVLADIQKESREIVAENGKRKATDEGEIHKVKKKRTEKVVNFEEVRRSARKRKPAKYCDDDDPEWKPKSEKKKVERKRKREDSPDEHINDGNPLPKEWKDFYNHVNNPFAKKARMNVDESSSDYSKGSAETGKRSMRERKKVNYDLDEVPRADEFIFCERCGEDKYFGCEIHPVIFDYVAKFDVGPSKVAKNAGRGVFNNNIRGAIPEGVMFGPYDGDFYTPSEYEELKKTRGESGKAWELRDPDKIKVIGFVDPGPNADPHTQWMSFVNCASKTRKQNLSAGQFLGGIYYQTIEVINFGQEALTYYGDEYAKDLRIKVEDRDYFELKEDWSEEGANCPHCAFPFTNLVYVQKHIDLVETGARGGCKALRRKKNAMEVSAGIRPYVCGECDQGFMEERHLTKHKVSHSDIKSFVCTLCDKAYKYKHGLRNHEKIEHEGQSFECPGCRRQFKSRSDLKQHQNTACDVGNQIVPFKCDKCGKKFNDASHLTRHIRSVHNQERPHKCDLCGKRFGANADLQHHILTIHNKVRPYKCDHCDADFTNASQRNYHTISQHTFMWPFSCAICDEELGKDPKRGFTAPSKLKAHMMRKHPAEYKQQMEDENPAVCTICQKRFPSYEQVSIHMKKMHGV